MTARAPAALLAAALLAGAPASGCAFAVDHPAITAGIVGGTLGLATCKLASDDIAACFAVGGGAGAFLGLVAAAALWLGGDGHSAVVEEQAQPLPEADRPTRPSRPSRRPADQPADQPPDRAADPHAPAAPPGATPPSPTPPTPPSGAPPSRSALRLPSATPRAAEPLLR
jgi:hypothetical protein